MEVGKDGAMNKSQKNMVLSIFALSVLLMVLEVLKFGIGVNIPSSFFEIAVLLVCVCNCTYAVLLLRNKY